MKAVSYDCHKVYLSVQLLNLQQPSWYACDWCHYSRFISQSSFRKLLLILLTWAIVFNWSKCTTCLSWVHKALMALTVSILSSPSGPYCRYYRRQCRSKLCIIKSTGPSIWVLCNKWPFKDACSMVFTT